MLIIELHIIWDLSGPLNCPTEKKEHRIVSLVWRSLHLNMKQKKGQEVYFLLLGLSGFFPFLNCVWVWAFLGGGGGYGFLLA